MIKNKLTEIKINDITFQVIINRKKIKHTYIRINDEYEIVVNTNRFTTRKQIEALILKNQNKIIKMVHNKKRQILPEDQIAFLGNVYKFRIEKDKKFAYHINRDHIIFYSPYTKDDTIDAFYKLMAEQRLPERLELCYNHFCKFYKISNPKLSIRKMKRRFGTCYYKRNQINLNVYLMKYDIPTIDYVIYHELAHFIQHNHSKHFYKLLQEVCPNHLKLRKNLNKYE